MGSGASPTFFSFSICSFQYYTFLTFLLSYPSWERGSTRGGVEAEIASFENECSIDIEWNSIEDILQPANYVEHWRLILWDKAFRMYFDDKDNFKFVKGIDLMEFEEGPIAIKRVTYR